MSIFIPFHNRLSQPLKMALRKGELSLKEVHNMKDVIYYTHGHLAKGFKRVVIIAVAIDIGLMVLSIPQMFKEPAALIFSFLLTSGIIAGILVGFKFLWVDSLKNQFDRAVREGYPNIQLDLLNGKPL